MITNERFATLFLNWWEITEKELTLSDMERLCKDIGMTRAEFIELITQSNEFISKDGWTPELEDIKKVNTEKEEVSVGDSDQAILETALTQIGINYEYYNVRNGDCCVELKDKNKNSLGVEIYFDANGNYIEIM